MSFMSNEKNQLSECKIHISKQPMFLTAVGFEPTPFRIAQLVERWTVVLSVIRHP